MNYSKLLFYNDYKGIRKGGTSATLFGAYDIIKRTIDTSDFYVLIIGYRYGSEMPDGVGYTEREFLYAKEKGVPVIVFIKREGLPVKETDREASASKKKKLKEFINKAKMGREVSW